MKSKKQKLKWEDVYKLPLKYDGISYAWTKDNIMALMFTDLVSNKNAQDIINIINGTENIKEDRLKWRVDGVDFYFNDLYLFCVRGWGHLTGVGGLNLSEQKAEQIQDDFIKYIISKIEGR